MSDKADTTDEHISEGVKRWGKPWPLETTTGWMPISAAPRDGTLVLVWPAYRTKQNIPTVSIAYWHQPGNPNVAGLWVGQWVKHPTHWMYLPEPPNEA